MERVEKGKKLGDIKYKFHDIEFVCQNIGKSVKTRVTRKKPPVPD